MHVPRLGTSTTTEQPSNGFDEFALVTLRHDVSHMGNHFRGGTQGTIVHKHNNYDYEVEFSEPVFAVVTVNHSNLDPL